MKISWKKLFGKNRRRISDERWFLAFISSTGLLLLALLWILQRGIPPRAEPITLHYTTSFGVDLIGSRNRMFFLPAFGAVVFFINTILAYLMLGRDRVMSYFLVSLSFVLTLFLGFAAWTLILQNR